LAIGHIPVRILRGTASNTVNFAGLACPLVLQPARLNEVGKMPAEDQQGPLLVNDRQPPFDPFAHGIPVNPKQTGDIFHRIGTVNFDKPVIGLAG
jgi:hypothetical protein